MPKLSAMFGDLRMYGLAAGLLCIVILLAGCGDSQGAAPTLPPGPADPTAALVPADTPTSLPTATATLMPAPTVTPLPTATATPAPTATAAPTAALGPTPTPTPAPTPTPTPGRDGTGRDGTGRDVVMLMVIAGCWKSGGR